MSNCGVLGPKGDINITLSPCVAHTEEGQDCKSQRQGRSAVKLSSVMTSQGHCIHRRTMAMLACTRYEQDLDTMKSVEIQMGEVLMKYHLCPRSVTADSCWGKESQFSSEKWLVF